MSRNDPTLDEYDVSILIPARNAAETASRLLDSLELLELQEASVDIVFVDDASTDTTGEIVCQRFQRFSLPTTYHRRHSRGGRAAAINDGVGLCKGSLVFIVDADDALPVYSVETLWSAWKSIPESSRHRFAGVEGLCADLVTSKVVGDAYPASPLDGTHLETRFDLGVKGDKKRALKRTVLAAHPYPLVEGEYHIPSSLIWNRIGLIYLTRYINAIVYLKEYRPEGITKNRPAVPMKNPRGQIIYYAELLDILRQLYPTRRRVQSRVAANLGRFGFHARQAPWTSAPAQWAQSDRLCRICWVGFGAGIALADTCRVGVRRLRSRVTP